MPLSEIHFIAMFGKKGCMPDYTYASGNRDKAINNLIEILELNSYGKFAKELRTYSYTSLPKHLFGGADYAEIKKCDCPDRNIHNED